MIFEIKRDEDLKYIKNQDIIIIGAGTIGLYMASRLYEENHNLKILLIEYGNEQSNLTKINSNAESIGKKHIGTLEGRACGIGGTSTLWGGQLAEFDEEDFEQWPIKYSDIKKYYNKVYSKLELGSVLSDKEYEEFLNGGIKNEFEIEHLYTRWLKEPNFYKFFERIINKNIKIIKNSMVTDINFNKDTATSIKCIGSNSYEYFVDGNKFIFANGTLGINQFFLSTAETSQVPWKKNLLIGQYFQDHLATKVGTLHLRNQSLFRQFYENAWIKGVKVQPKLKFSKQARKNKKNGVVLFFTFTSKFENSIYRIKKMIKSPKKLLNIKSLSIFFSDIYYLRKSFIISAYKLLFKKRIHVVLDNDNSIEINIQSEQIANINSKITIDKNKKLENGLFKTQTKWMYDDDEVDAIKDLCINVDKFFKKIGVGKIDFNKNFHGKLHHSFHDTYHHCGGTKMSLNKDGGVVDKHCKVWETSNIWIAGAAVFPSSSHANSTLTALALCERMIKETELNE